MPQGYSPEYYQRNKARILAANKAWRDKVVRDTPVIKERRRLVMAALRLFSFNLITTEEHNRIKEQIKQDLSRKPKPAKTEGDSNV